MRAMLQYCVFLLLLVVGITPFVMMISRSATCRAQMRALGCSLSCFSLSACFDGCCSQRVHYDEHDLRTLQELEEPARPVGITGAYRMYQARRARMSLRLASWHEDVKKCGGHDPLHCKLQMLHAQALESRGTDAIGCSSNSSSYSPPRSSAPASSSAAATTTGVPFDIQIVEINDRVNEDTSSERSYDLTAYAAMPETPVADRRRALELRLQDDEEEKDDVYAVV